MLYCILSVF